MAQDAFIKKNIEYFRDAVKKSKDDNDLDRTLMLFAKEIERETRHAAVNMAQKLAHDIEQL